MIVVLMMPKVNIKYFITSFYPIYISEKEGNTIGLKNPSVSEEKGADTSL